MCALRGWLMAGLLMSSACDVFDEDLEALIDSEGQGDSGSEVESRASDTCEDDMPMLESSSTSFEFAVGSFASTKRESGECALGSDVLGRADAFFRIETSAGDRWHFHLDGAEGQDLAVYVAETCDVRTCLSGADVCADGESEHFTFVPEQTGSYVIGVEGIDVEASEALSLLAIQPTCGNGMEEHSEVCDDGNVSAGDGCDRHCRRELADDTNDEDEPNDDPFGANVLLADANETIAVAGLIGGSSCQPDYFFFQPQEDGTASVAMLGATGEPCMAAPNVSVELWQADGDQLRPDRRLEMGSENDGTCPTLTATVSRDEGYFVKLSAAPGDEQFSYDLEVTVTTP